MGSYRAIEGYIWRIYRITPNIGESDGQGMIYICRSRKIRHEPQTQKLELTRLTSTYYYYDYYH